MCDSLTYGPIPLSPMASWLPVALTIADFLVQRVDRVGPVKFEKGADQPPEQAQRIMSAPDVEAPPVETGAGPAEVDTPKEAAAEARHDHPAMGFQARGGGTDPSGGGGGSEDDDDEKIEHRARSMRVTDQPTTHEV